MTDERTFLTVEEVASELRVHPETVRRWIRAGDIHAIVLGKSTGFRIEKAEFEAFLKRRGSGGAPDAEKSAVAA